MDRVWFKSRPNEGPAAQLADLAEEFLDSKLHLARASQEFYRLPLETYFLPWAQREGIGPADLNAAAVARWSATLGDDGGKIRKELATASRNAYKRAVNQFLIFLENRDDRRIGRARATPMRKVHRTTLTPKECQALEDACATERDKLMVHLACRFGVRLGEIASLRVRDLHLEDGEGVLVVRGKTGERPLPLEQPLYRRLRGYVEHNRKRTASNALFLGERRRQSGDYEGLVEGAVYHIVKQAAEDAGITKRVHPHGLRHTAITLMQARGVPIEATSQLTGASIPVLMKHYYHPTMSHLREALRAAD